MDTTELNHNMHELNIVKQSLSVWDNQATKNLESDV